MSQKHHKTHAEYNPGEEPNIGWLRAAMERMRRTEMDYYRTTGEHQRMREHAVRASVIADCIELLDQGIKQPEPIKPVIVGYDLAQAEDTSVVLIGHVEDGCLVVHAVYENYTSAEVMP